MQDDKQSDSESSIIHHKFGYLVCQGMPDTLDHQCDDASADHHFKVDSSDDFNVNQTSYLMHSCASYVCAHVYVHI